MKFNYSDGGRSKYFKGETRDCVCRAICNATGRDYKEIYDLINEISKNEHTGKRKKKTSNARTGVYKYTEKEIIENILHWKWTPTMTIGSGCTMHLDENEIPEGVLIVKVSHHLTCVKNKEIYDTFDCSRGGNRCVYGYWKGEGEIERSTSNNQTCSKQPEERKKRKVLL